MCARRNSMWRRCGNAYKLFAEANSSERRRSLPARCRGALCTLRKGCSNWWLAKFWIVVTPSKLLCCRSAHCTLRPVAPEERCETTAVGAGGKGVANKSWFSSTSHTYVCMFCISSASPSRIAAVSRPQYFGFPVAVSTRRSIVLVLRPSA